MCLLLFYRISLCCKLDEFDLSKFEILKLMIEISINTYKYGYYFPMKLPGTIN